jgi:hypothetical protein
MLAQPDLREDDADKEECAEPHDLVQLQTGNIIEQLWKFQGRVFYKNGVLHITKP